MTVKYFIKQPFIITLPLSQYDLNSVEKVLKHQIIRVLDKVLCQYFFYFSMKNYAV